MLEKLIQLLTDLVAALNANTAALKGAKPAKPGKGDTAPAEEKKPDTATVTHPTVQDIRDAAKALLDATGNNDGGLFAKLCTEYGVKKISEVADDKRAEVIAKIKAAVPAKPAAPSPSEQI